MNKYTEEKRIREMNILVIGNGFDLAHGLPTKYTDFLEFCEMAREIYESKKIDNHLYKALYLDESNLNEEIKEQLLTIFASRKDHRDITDDSKIIHTFTTSYPRSDELNALLKDNFWIEYFLQCNMHGKKNWIDFESEISGVIQSLEKDMHGLAGGYNIDDDMINLSNNFLNEKYSKYTFTIQVIDSMSDQEKSENITFREIRNKLLNDLHNLIRALEIYLCEYVSIIEIQKKSPDIECLEINKILSFNYTDIFLKLYKKALMADEMEYFDYIHGKADANNTIKSNNMVLGIDEYLGKKRRNKDVEFIAFKKFYQRIHKQTGCKYKEWVDQIRQEWNNETEESKAEIRKCISKGNLEKPKIHKLYIFGHSLDITDKDVLCDLILNDNVHTTIFYHNKDAMGQQIANLVKVIGQKELIKRTGGSTKTIEFKPQQLMIEKDRK